MPVVLLIVAVPFKTLLHNSIYSLGLHIFFRVEAGRHLLLYSRKVAKGLQEYGILPHSRTYYCLLFSLYHMFIIFVISY